MCISCAAHPPRGAVGDGNCEGYHLSRPSPSWAWDAERSSVFAVTCFAQGLTKPMNGTSLCSGIVVFLAASLKGGHVKKRTIAASGIALGVLLIVVGCIFVGNIHPIASFTADPTAGNTPVDVDFDASGSSDTDGTIATYAWDFGDGQTASFTVDTIFSHQYTVQTNSEVFRVVLTVTDNLGAEDQAVVDITVNP